MCVCACVRACVWCVFDCWQNESLNQSISVVSVLHKMKEVRESCEEIPNEHVNTFFLKKNGILIILLVLISFSFLPTLLPPPPPAEVQAEVNDAQGISCF